MKILEVITSLLTGGAEHIVVELALKLRKRGHQVDVVVFNGEETPFMRSLTSEEGNADDFSSDNGGMDAGNTLPDIKVYKLGNSFYNPLYIPKLRRIMKDYDVVHTHNSSPQLFAAIANIGLGKRLVTTEHNTSNSKRSHPIWSRMDKWMYRKYDRIVCISKQAEDNLREYVRPDSTTAASIELILNGVDVESIYNAMPYADGDLKDIEGNDVTVNGMVNIIQVAAFRPQKDQKCLIDATGFMPENYRVWLVGDGEMHDELHRYAEGNEKVVFFGNRQDVARLLKTADIVCMSTHYEGLSLSNVEGMSAGRPFVASDVQGIHEVTEGAGILVAEGDARAFADTFVRLHDDNVYCQMVADRCHERAMMYDIKSMIDEYERVLTESVNDNA